MTELGGLAHLRLIDLRFNGKLKSAAGLLATHVPQAQAMLLTPDFVPRDRMPPSQTDAAKLQAQLEPLCTSELRRRHVLHTGVKPTR